MRSRFAFCAFDSLFELMDWRLGNQTEQILMTRVTSVVLFLQYFSSALSAQYTLFTFDYVLWNSVQDDLA